MNVSKRLQMARRHITMLMCDFCTRQTIELRNNEMLKRFIQCALAAALVTQSIPAHVNASPIQDKSISESNQEPDKAEAEKKQEEIEKLGREARHWFNNGEYAKALSNAKAICKLDPEDIRFQSFLGEVSFANGQFDTCVTAYDAMIRITPSSEPRLWQRGLALYYADRFEDGVKQFETHQTVNSQDVENAVWHLLCAAKVSDIDEARKKLIPITGDTRVPMSQIYEMFAGRMTPQQVVDASLKTSVRVKNGDSNHKLQQYFAHLYIGLYHEMLGNKEAAMASLKEATEINPLGKSNFMGQVARVHVDIREKQAKHAGQSKEKTTSATDKD